jgi:hypothetical protein
MILRPYIGTPGEYRREIEIYAKRAKDLRWLAERDVKIAQVLLDAAEALECVLPHLEKVIEHLRI